jgi:subtilisin
MATAADHDEFILLPPQGVRAGAGPAGARGVAPIGRFLEAVAHATRGVMRLRETGAAVRVLDSVHEDGAQLVQMSPADVLALRTAQPGLRVVPIVHYRPARSPRPSIRGAAMVARGARRPAATTNVVVRVVSQGDGKPVAGAEVYALTDYDAGEGADGLTKADGTVRLRLRASARTIERLYVYPVRGLWGALKRGVTVRDEMQVGLRPLDLASPDALRHFYATARPAAGRGVTVGIVDTGVGPHADLALAGGENTVRGERTSDWHDNGDGHGTHVAGIVAARGAARKGVRGLAPGVHLRSYRVFGKGKDYATNYAILKALDRAVADGCDLVNMSLGGGDPDEATRAAIADARAQGVLVIAAAGNDGRRAVSYPAAEQLAVAVSAMGRRGTFPADSTHWAEVMRPYGRDRANFVAAFSNVGPEIDLTAPGVAIVSTVPGGYAAYDGTSMACPAVTGAAAALLARNRRVLGLPRGQARSDEMARIVFAAARTLGFGAKYEGRGML